MKLADCRQGSLEDTETALREGLALFRAHGNEIREGAALRELGHLAYLSGDGQKSRQLTAEAIELLERHPPGEELASALTRRAGTLGWPLNRMRL